MDNRKKIAVLMLCAALLVISAAIVLVVTGSGNAHQNHKDGGYMLTITGPWGTVYPYSDIVRSFYMAENPNISDHYVAGTAETGDTSFKPVVITWNDSDSASVTKYIVEYATKPDYSDAISVERHPQLEEKQVEVYNLYKASTYYVRVSAYAGETLLGQAESVFATTQLGPRVMKIDSVYNVRDLGGYVTEDGKLTAQGMVFRGSEMDGGNGIELSTDGNTYMSLVLGIQTDLDLRGNQSHSPISSAQKVAVGIGGYMEAFNQKEQYRKIFATFADESNYPVYVHCMGGADRTGTVCFLLNALLGVPEEELYRDYEMTSYSWFGDRTRKPGAYDFAPFVDKLKTYPGDMLAEKTENYMLSIGITQEQIQSIRSILITDIDLSGSQVGQWDSKDAALPAELADADPKHIFDSNNWSNDDFVIGYLGKIQEDPASSVGTAVVYDVQKWETSDRSAFTVPMDGGLPVYYYQKPGVEMVIGQIPYSQLAANANDGKYHLYGFQDITCMANSTSQSAIYMFGWAFQNTGLPRKIIAGLNNTPVDIYISMKIEGHVSGVDPTQQPKYWIDRVILVTECGNFELVNAVSNNDATCVDGTKTGTCPQCGGQATVTDVGSRKDHAFTQFVSNNNGTAHTEGTKTAVCDYGCGTICTLYESGSTLPAELANVAPERIFTFTSEDFAGDAFYVAADPDSVVGQAMIVDASKHGGATNNPYRVTKINPLHVALWSSKETLVFDLYSDDLYQDGQYHLYKLEDVALFQEGTYNFLYMFTTWELRSYVLPKEVLRGGVKGHKVDFYLSMKIQGNTLCEDLDTLPVYYIDRIIIVDKE